MDQGYFAAVQLCILRTNGFEQVELHSYLLPLIRSSPRNIPDDFLTLTMARVISFISRYVPTIRPMTLREGGDSNEYHEPVTMCRANPLAEFKEGEERPVFANLGRDGLRRDTTWNFGHEERNGRAQYGPRWELNSCAADCVLMVMLCLDFGLVRSDYLAIAQLKALYENRTSSAKHAIHYVMREFLGHPWGLDSEERMQSATNMLKACLRALRKTAPGYESLNLLLLECTAGFGQVSFFSKSVRSCSANPTHYRTTRVMECRLVEIPEPRGGVTLASAISAIFHDNRINHVRCNRQGCNAFVATAFLVVDRLPPRLMVDTQRLSLADFKQDLDAPLQIQYVTLPGRTIQVTYRVLVVFHCSHNPLHYVVSWRDADGWRRYDGKRGNTAVSREDMARDVTGPQAMQTVALILELQ